MIGATLKALNSGDPERTDWQYFSNRWEEVKASAHGLDLPHVVEGLGNRFPSITVRIDSQAAQAMRSRISESLLEVQRRLVKSTERQADNNGKRGETFVLANEIGWEDYFPTYKQFAEFLERTPEIRWKKPTPNSRAVHAADWQKYWSAHTERPSDFLDLRPEVLDAIANAQRRKQEKDHHKRRK